MFIFATFFEALALLLSLALKTYMWIIIARALISWVNPDPYNFIVQFLHRVTDPVLEPIRRIIPMHSIGIDISPIVAIFGVYFLQAFLVPVFYQLAQFFR
ncbi:MAG: YggT family protein [Deltaproteobacteria bacterium]|nr:YggT family protein [Deltaproteobacteria bacterium]